MEKIIKSWKKIDILMSFNLSITDMDRLGAVDRYTKYTIKCQPKQQSTK